MTKRREDGQRLLGDDGPGESPPASAASEERPAIERGVEAETPPKSPESPQNGPPSTPEAPGGENPGPAPESPPAGAEAAIPLTLPAIRRSGMAAATGFEPENFDQAMAVARLLIQAKMEIPGLLPEPIKSAAAAWAIMAKGRELGFSLLQSFAAINVIKGTPAVSAEGLRSLVLRSGACEYLIPVEITPTSATWATRRKGTPREVSFTYNLEMARRAGLADKDNYRKNPEFMYSARSSSGLCRMVYPDIVMGIFTPEEAEEINAAGNSTIADIEAKIRGAESATELASVALAINAALADGTITQDEADRLREIYLVCRQRFTNGGAKAGDK